MTSMRRPPSLFVSKQKRKHVPLLFQSTDSNLPPNAAVLEMLQGAKAAVFDRMALSIRNKPFAFKIFKDMVDSRPYINGKGWEIMLCMLRQNMGTEHLQRLLSNHGFTKEFPPRFNSNDHGNFRWGARTFVRERSGRGRNPRGNGSLHDIT